MIYDTKDYLTDVAEELSSDESAEEDDNDSEGTVTANDGTVVTLGESPQKTK